MPEFIVDHWDEAVDGVLSRDTMREKLRKQVSCRFSIKSLFSDFQGYSVTPYTFSPGNSFPTHTHDVDKKDVVVDGELEFTMYDKTIILKSGDTLVVPKGVPHSAKVLGNKKLEFFDATKM